LTESELRKLFDEDLKIYFDDSIWKSFVLGTMLDPRKTGRVNFSVLKFYFGEGQHGSPPVGAKA
jgi:hypothetical protein